MPTINMNIQPQGSLSNGTSAVARANGDSENAQSTGAPITAAGPVAQGDRVTISGHAMLVSRLFGTDAAHYDGKVRTTPLGEGGNNYDYLTTSDRKMVEDMYEYCATNGIDLAYVDTLALDLAIYRLNDGSYTNDATIYDLEGHRLTFEWQGQDKEIVDRVLQSDKIQQTSIDQGFLQAEFKPGGRFADFAFVEKMIAVFSPAGGAQDNSNESFKVYTPTPINVRIHTTKSEAVELVIPEPDFISIDGVGSWRTPELAAAANSKPGLALGTEAMSSNQLGRGLLAMLTSYAESKNIDMKHINDLASLLERYRPYQAK